MLKTILFTVLFFFSVINSLSVFGQEDGLLNYPDQLVFHEKELVLAGKQGNVERYLLEYIDPERNWDNWSNLLAFRNYNGYNPKFVLDYHVASIQKNNPDVKYAIYEHPKKKNIYILDFLTGIYDGDNPSYEFNLWFIFPLSESETISIQYALRSYENPDLDKHPFNSATEFGEYWTKNRSKLISELETISENVKTYINN